MRWKWGVPVLRGKRGAGDRQHCSGLGRIGLGRPGSGRMMLAMPLLAVLGKCDFTMVSGERLQVTAVDVCRSGHLLVSVHSFKVEVKKENGRYPFRLRKAQIITYLERNGLPGFQPPADLLVTNRGTESEIAQGHVTVGALSNRGSSGVTASHWAIWLETDKDTDGNGKLDSFYAYGDFGN